MLLLCLHGNSAVCFHDLSYKKTQNKIILVFRNKDSFNFSQIKEQYYRYFAADSHPVVARVA